MNQRVQALVFIECDNFWLSMSPMKVVMRYTMKGKICPIFIDLLRFLSRVGEVADKLVLPPSLSALHHVFHVSIL